MPVSDKEVEVLLTEWLTVPTLNQVEHRIVSLLQDAFKSGRNSFDIAARTLFEAHSHAFYSAVMKASVHGVKRHA